jgi:hypothetical protein
MYGTHSYKHHKLGYIKAGRRLRPGDTSRTTSVASGAITAESHRLSKHAVGSKIAHAMIHGSGKRNEFADLANVIHAVAPVILPPIVRRKQAVLGFGNYLIHRMIHRSAQWGSSRQVVDRRSLQDLQHPGRVSRHASRKLQYIAQNPSSPTSQAFDLGFSEVRFRQKGRSVMARERPASGVVVNVKGPSFSD